MFQILTPVSYRELLEQITSLIYKLRYGNWSMDMFFQRRKDLHDFQEPDPCQWSPFTTVVAASMLSPESVPERDQI